MQIVIHSSDTEWPISTPPVSLIFPASEIVYFVTGYMSTDEGQYVSERSITVQTYRLLFP